MANARDLSNIIATRAARTVTGSIYETRAPFAPQVGATLKRKAAEPLKASKPQDFDTSALPLFGDAKNQGELF